LFSTFPRHHAWQKYFFKTFECLHISLDHFLVYCCSSPI
jgi:hypothetical protein